MNFLHLKYAVEVERTRSITKAAENLYMVQPNLSRAIKELEESIGITIFRRTSKGIVPTPQGEEFLTYAKNILGQVEEIESIYKKGDTDKITFNISIPRASYITHAFIKLVASMDMSKEIEINYKETNSLRAIINIVQGNYTLGIIRYQTTFEDYFQTMLKEKHLKGETIWEFEYLALMSAAHPLAKRKKIRYPDLSDSIEIAHGDPYVPSMPLTEVMKTEFSDLITKRIFVYERGSQFDLLCDIPNTYIWVSPIPAELIERYNLVQRKCLDANRQYRDVLIYAENYKMTALENQFIEELQKVKKEISAISYQ
jgi:DNA-binding transcriptional LysR family regulator